MLLRAELMPPIFDETQVAHLASLASFIDGANPGQWEDELNEFNRIAGTSVDFSEFQGVHGGQSHETWVRSVLVRGRQLRVDDITRDELIELTRRVMKSDGTEHEISFWMRMLALNIPDPFISDLIFWPGEYFADGDNSRVHTPEQVVDIALSRAARGTKEVG